MMLLTQNSIHHVFQALKEYRVIGSLLFNLSKSVFLLFFLKYAMQVLKKEKVDYIVAPYEADAQMAFLSINKLVDAVITEDSDLIPFGCLRVSHIII
jgi:XPG I-region